MMVYISRNFKFQKDEKKSTPFKMFQLISQDIYNEENKFYIWRNSPFEMLDKLKNDCSGKAGEMLVEKLCKDGNVNYSYNNGKTTPDGCYDIIINKKKVEIKTAKLGKQKSFQHECLRLSGYDYLLFVDVCPHYYYLTIIPRFNLRLKSIIFGRKAHLRKGTNDVFKLDWNEKILKSTIQNGYTIKVYDTTQLDELILFMNKNIK